MWIGQEKRGLFHFGTAAIILAFGMTSNGTVGQTIELRPVNNGISRPVDAPFIPGATIVGNTLSIIQGGVNVELEVITSGWGNLPANPTLASASTVIDSQGFQGANASPAQPGVNLNPLGWPATPAQGAFQVTQVCSTSGRDCGNGQPSCSGPEGACIVSTRFVLNCCAPSNVVDTASLDYRFSSEITAGAGAIDPGAGPSPATYGYLGTLLLQVPGAASTTYTVSPQNGSSTYLCPADCTSTPLPTLVPATIRVITGSCCTTAGPGVGVCTPNVTQAMCNALPTTTTRLFIADTACEELPPCCMPLCHAHDHCVDYIPGSPGSVNRCTANLCTAWCCEYLPLYDPATQCCNGNVGPSIGLATLSDGNECTLDECDLMTGIPIHTPLTGTPCSGGWACAVNDTCQDGICTDGVDVNTMPCDDDGDCLAGSCNLATGFCSCMVARSPHDVKKNRYISFSPDADLSTRAFRVEKLTAPVGVCWVSAPDAAGRSKCGVSPVFRVWTEPVIHVGDCEIVPVASYRIRSTTNGVVFGMGVDVDTIALPSLNSKWWGDIVGSNNGSQWTAPNQITNVQDVLAVAAFITNAAIRPSFEMVNVQAVSSTDPCLNAFVNTADLFIIVKAVAGEVYPFITDMGLCPGC